MQLIDIFVAMLLMGLLILLAQGLHLKLPFLSRYFIPTSVVAGLLGLLLGPQVVGEDLSLWPDATTIVWSGLPELLISVVFACLFLGKKLASPRQIWRMAGPMVAHGQTLAWGQYVIGLSLALLILTPLFGVSPLAGAVIEIGFEGGHGTSAGLADTFAELGFESGADLALGLATVGIVAGVLLGTLLVNWGRYKGLIKDHEVTLDKKKKQSQDSVPASLLESMTLHLAFIALAISLGWLLLQGLILIESFTWNQQGDGLELMGHMPLFPLAMLGGVLIQMLLTRLGRGDLLDSKLISRISGTALDVLIVAAIATLSLATVAEYIGPFLILAVAGVSWCLFGFLLLAPRIFPRDWLPMGLADFGQSIGTTVVGLLLVRMADPLNKTGTLESFGYKQLLFEPFVGGGVATAMSLPMIYYFGALPVLLVCAAIMLFWLCVGLFVFGPEKETQE
ncbi:sodium:glutamate symporter [Aliidiomarina minuta]|uniref:Sodium:glutamate symporter n=1 Tax=Aliidiomarina minuta TaxID=880057 RepID=A0A432W133_9GAMM|nr:sodium/glutamate symporter [Aliidiomarina minuta]RUO22934.1 sodium:glutamate symporter [Aliidiomarina minuta]